MGNSKFLFFKPIWVFSPRNLFHQNYWAYWQKLFLIFFNLLILISTILASSLSFLTLIICVFSFFLVNIDSLSILIIFQRMFDFINFLYTYVIYFINFCSFICYFIFYLLWFACLFLLLCWKFRSLIFKPRFFSKLNT